MTKVINIADLKKAPAVVIVVDDVRHEMKEPTVDDFIANMELIEELGIKASPKAEMLATVQVVLRAFPTLTEAQVRSWSLENIQQLSDLARNVGGEVVTDPKAIAEAEATGNVQPAI